MTQIELLAQLRTYLGGELGNAAADEIERLAEDCQRWEMAARIARDGFDITTIARVLAERGMTVVSAADAEKIKRCDCGWRPIESAPKDQDIWLWFPTMFRKGHMTVGRWDSDQYAQKPRPYWTGSISGLVNEYRRNPPTHWQPLPTPPNGGAE